MVFVVVVLFFSGCDCGYNCRGGCLWASENDVLFLRGLVDRNLFESVEFFCNNEFQEPKISAAEKNVLAAELVRSRTQQMFLAAPKRRTEIRNQLAEFETQQLRATDESTDSELALARMMLQFHFEIT
jgi:hypothetical protein